MQVPLRHLTCQMRLPHDLPLLWATVQHVATITPQLCRLPSPPTMGYLELVMRELAMMELCSHPMRPLHPSPIQGMPATS